MSAASYQTVFLAEESFLLLPQKALYRPEKKQLILSDVHLGKATHFRKMGLPMPAQSHLKDVDALYLLLKKYQPQSCMILGDLFHSEYNREWLWFHSLLLEFSQVQFILVEGNHDILPDSAYAIPNLLKTGLLEENHFIFSHHPLKEQVKLNICGHVHPGIRIQGFAKQSMTLPCFYLDAAHLILPAFGNLTGLFLLEQQENADYFLVANHKVVRL